MTEALQLFPLPPSLTPRQQKAFDAIAAAGWGGLTSDEIGAHLHQHPDGGVCTWCPSAGREVSEALRRKQLVRQRRVTAPNRDVYMTWITVDARKPTTPLAQDFPPGF